MTIPSNFDIIPDKKDKFKLKKEKKGIKSILNFDNIIVAE